MQILNVNNLYVSYGKHEVLQDISFNIHQGDYMAIIGPNGSGKTTLVKTLLGILEPIKGQIEKDKNLEIGYLPQRIFANDSLFPATVYEVISTGIMINKKFSFKLNSYYKEKIDKVLQTLNIFELRNKRIGSLSGGQQQRVLLARALVTSSNMLILDEPTSALDPIVKEDFYNIINELNKKYKITIILISHDLSSSGKYTNKILFLNKKIMFFGTYEQFKHSDHIEFYYGDCPVHLNE